MDLKQWLTAHRLENYIDVFRQNDIGADVLTKLTEEDLKEMGLPIGARRRFLTAVNPEGHSQTRQPSPEQPSVQPASQPAAQQPPVQQPTAPAGPQQQVELQPANQPVQTTHPAIQQSPHLAPSASSPQAQATRHQPKAKNSRKATAITVAVGVHVAIIVLATTLTIFAASKDEPEIIAAIAPPSTTPQQEMQKKTVQKQVKRAPSAASAAAAPMAQMMKANAEARFTTPEVTRTSTGPLGVGEGDLGTGAFGVGSGLGDAGNGGSFFGTPTSGNLAVIFDVSGSMAEASMAVVSEINRNFKTAHVVCVFGARFEVKPGKLVTYQSNKSMQETLQNQSNHTMNKNMLSLGRCDSIEMKKAWPKGSLKDLSKEARAKQMQTLQSLGTAMEALLNQKRPPGTIFVFSDFRDGVDPKYMIKLANLAKQKKVKIVIWYPYSDESEFTDRKHYQTFVKTTGGELKIKKL